MAKDRDLPQAYGRAGGRLDRTRPGCFFQASEVMMWPNFALDLWQVHAERFSF